MTGGLIQLVAYGVQDLFLTRDPQITFFKVVYRRHTNFSVEQKTQFFVTPPNFGKTSTCILSNQGDLIQQIYLIIVLPQIKQFYTTPTQIDNNTKFAWIRKIGFGMIDYIEIEIGGQVIDRHYGEWLNLWHEMFMPKNLDKSLNNMIGNIPDLYNFTNGKDSHTLYIPLQFWFCRNSGLALPMVALQYSEVKIRVVIKDADSCYIITPTNYIQIYNDIVNFQPLEYIEQNINGRIASGIFTYYDLIQKRLYYKKISKNDFTSISGEAIYGLDIIDTIFSNNNRKYSIHGISSNNIVMQQINTTSKLCTLNIQQIENISIQDCFLLVNYIYLDSDERLRFIQSKHDYLIEQVSYVNEKVISSYISKIKLDLLQPSKLIVWVVQQDYLQDKVNNDFFNYTDNYMYVGDKPIGKNFIVNETIRLNDNDRISMRSFQYFSQVQSYQYLNHNPNEGINLYSFCNFPDKFQPSGSCNMSQIDNALLILQLGNIININNIAKMRAYSFNYNVLRIVNGLSGIVFTK